MIEVKSVGMNYGNTKALDEVSFVAEKGKILGLLGPNGAGKTTLMRILTSYLYPSKGTATIDGHDVTEEPLAARRLIGYMPETVPLYDDMLVDEYLIFIGSARGLGGEQLRQRLRWVKENCGLGPIWKHTISEISKGFRQRAGLAQALIHDPQVLILDEPMTGLDPLQIIGIRELMHRLAQDKTVIFSTHILQEVEALADRIVILNNGRMIAEGTRHEITQMATKGEKLTLVVKADENDVRSTLENEEVVDELRFVGSEGNYIKFFVSADTGKPLVSRLNEVIDKKGWSIRELKREQASLEEAFIWLLSRDQKKDRR
ncbi:MAG: ATP-binding cassette domain-containing protein [Candidatus Omnitrophica bacterium]|nr:ATP-binding cassette domain-containing protein [Candidatus Omnitrophota bacterium]